MPDSQQKRATETEHGPVSGAVLAGISNGMVRLFRDYFGRGPTAAKTYALDDVVVCVLRDGLTPAERTLFERGRADAVREIRAAFQDVVADEFKSVVEELTDRRVVAFMSQAHVDPDLAVEIFFLDSSLPDGHARALETDGNGDPIHDG
jgi:uncharacterized protein YbcI